MSKQPPDIPSYFPDGRKILHPATERRRKRQLEDALNERKLNFVLNFFSVPFLRAEQDKHVKISSTFISISLLYFLIAIIYTQLFKKFRSILKCFIIKKVLHSNSKVF